MCINVFGLIGLLGGRGLLGEDGRGHSGDMSCAKETALLAAIANNKDVSVAEARAIGSAICDAEKTNLQQFYAAAIQAANNTSELKAQAFAIATATDSKIDLLSRQVAADGDATRALITQNIIDSLREQAEGERRRADKSELNITMIQSQAQAQQQQQQQAFDTKRCFDHLFNSIAIIGNQVAQNTNSQINVGSGVLAGTQSANPVNVK